MVNQAILMLEAIDKSWQVCYSASQSPVKEVPPMPQAYCMKCRKKVEIKNAKSITLKNKRPATQGECPNCGTKVFRIGKA
jgi:DNA-directed RNA polymerase subunit RPC12/RpoP